jgi:hypothetical protein
MFVRNVGECGVALDVVHVERLAHVSTKYRDKLGVAKERNALTIFMAHVLLINCSVIIFVNV